MKIDITKSEYRDLLDILYIADWVLNAHKVEADLRTERYKTLEQKLLSYAKEMGFENLAGFNPELDQHIPTGEFEATSSAMTFIEEFENDSFWEGLIERLAERDLIRQVGGFENVVQLSIEERFEKIGRIEDKYAAEFQANGLDNLKID